MVIVLYTNFITYIYSLNCFTKLGYLVSTIIFNSILTAINNTTINPNFFILLLYCCIIGEVLDPMNVELRAKVRKELRLVLKSVKYRVISKSIFVSLEYYTNVLAHVIVINNQRGGGDVQTEFSIEEHDENRVYRTDSFALSYKNGDEVPKFHTFEGIPINNFEYLKLRDLIEEVEGNGIVASWMNRNYDFIFNPSDTVRSSD